MTVRDLPAQCHSRVSTEAHGKNPSLPHVGPGTNSRLSSHLRELHVGPREIANIQLFLAYKNGNFMRFNLVM